MNLLDRYIIPFSGLAEGKHVFDYLLDDDFFEAFEYNEFHNSDIHVSVELLKKSGMLVFDFSFEGIADFACDRCLDEYHQKISAHEELIVKFAEESQEEKDGIIILSHTEHQINIAKFMFDTVILSLPYRHIHPDDENGNCTCNPEMIKIIEKLSVHNKHDDRWDALKNISLS